MKAIFNLAKVISPICFLLIVSSVCVAQMNEPITPIPQSIPTDPAKVKLGKKLFFDKRLSVNDSVSCESCHNLKEGFGADLKPVSDGVNNKKGTRNSPTVFNTALNFTQFWDGRSEDLSKQAVEPVINPVEMGMPSWDAAVAKLKDNVDYKTAFEQVYGGPMNAERLVNAIAEYEKTLITPNAPFDKYLNGDQSAISDEQKRGYQLFKAYGCVSCHQGQNVGGNMFQKLGVLKNISLSHGSLHRDLGRYTVTGNEWDKRVFKVPSLRLAAKTPPYFHDGSVSTLLEAVDVMIEYQLGREVPMADRLAIVAFLESLVGEIPKGVN